MSKIKGFFSFFGLVFTQVAAPTMVIAMMELVLSRMGLLTTGSWQFYLLHLLLLLPCLLVLTPAGYFSDKHPKEKVLLWTTVLSLPVSGLLTLSAFWGSFPLAYVSIGLFFILQAFQAPAKNGYMKELMGVRYLSTGSGILMIVTFVSIVLSAGGVAVVFDRVVPPTIDFWNLYQSLLPVTVAIAVIELIGILFALRLPAIGAYDEFLKFPWNKYFNLKFARRKVYKSWKNRAVRQSIIGLSMFWVMIFLMFFVVQEKFITGDLLHGDLAATYSIVGAAIGLVLGFAYAMRMSKAFIETGLIPLGTAGAAILIFVIPLIPSPYNAIAFACLGFCGGIYMLPMLSLLLYNTKPRSAGHVLSVNNAVQNLSVLLFYGLVVLARKYWGFDRMDLFFILGFVCLAGTIWALWAMPHTMLRQIMRTFLSIHYRLMVKGLKHLPWEGPVLLLGNHVSYIDWVLLQMASPRPIRFVICRQAYEKWYIRLLLSQMNVIDLDFSKPEEAMEKANAALKNGEVVAMFPENGLSPTGKVLNFRLKFERALDGVENLKLVPFYIQGLWGSTYSNASAGYRTIVHSGGRVICVVFGKTLPPETSPVQLKRHVQDLSITAWETYSRVLKPIANSWIRSTKRKRNSPVVFSPDGKHLSGYSLATAAFSFSKMLEKLTKGEKCVGVMIPPSGPGIIVNMALLIKGKTVTNLNYSSTPETMDYCCNLADVKTIITAHAFVDKLKKKGVPLENLLDKYKVLYMEDLAKQLKKPTLALNYLRVMLLPSWLLERLYIKKVGLDDVATVIFSSGSEGKPKGVELTQLNLMGEIKQCAHDLNPGPEDVFLGILPLFHAFGFSITTMMCLVEGIPIATCPDPTDARLVGRICAQFKVSVMVSTGTFLRMWGGSRHVHPLMFSHLRLIYAGAEKIREDVRTLFRTKFKIEIFEGFGCTETTPVAAVNTFDTLLDDYKTVIVGNKPGTVGTPLPGAQFRVVDPDTLEELPLGEDGLILIGGSQVMKGYLKDPERTAQALAIIDGHRWYKTGDKGHIDEDGFITIVDRYSRFAKLGGEMISLGAVDFKISENSKFDEIEHFAVAVPDGSKGEKIALVYCGEPSEDELKSMLKEVGLPPLMLPSYVVKVDALPKLGSGKADVQTGKKIAIERLGLQNL
ncbi:MAG: MFS transporter [Fibrobacter sp.]|nr:MFS transporter [Fibrobacter sp.]